MKKVAAAPGRRTKLLGAAPDRIKRGAFSCLPDCLIFPAGCRVDGARSVRVQQLLESMPPNDEIRIEDLELSARVGVPAEERAQPQRLTISLTLQPRHSFDELGDELARTVDYAAVCDELRNLAREREDKLIETLADALATHLLARFDLARVELELRKFILPDTKYVAVKVARTASRERL